MRPFILAAVCLGVLSSCQEQRTVVLEQSSSANLASNGTVSAGSYRPSARPPAPSSPCNAPIGTGPYEPLPSKPAMIAVVYKPSRVMAERRPSCVGMRFRIAPDGAPQDIEAVAEFPLGYGMADFGQRAVSAMRWPARDDLAWRYLVITLRPDRPSNPGA